MCAVQVSCYVRSKSWQQKNKRTSEQCTHIYWMWYFSTPVDCSILVSWCAMLFNRSYWRSWFLLCKQRILFSTHSPHYVQCDHTNCSNFIDNNLYQVRMVFKLSCGKIFIIYFPVVGILSIIQCIPRNVHAHSVSIERKIVYKW